MQNHFEEAVTKIHMKHAAARKKRNTKTIIPRNRLKQITTTKSKICTEIHITLQFFRASGPQGFFCEKTKKKTHCYIWSREVCVPNFRSVSFVVWPGGVTHKYTHKYIHTHIQVKIGISSAGRSPCVDFEKEINPMFSTLWERIKVGILHQT